MLKTIASILISTSLFFAASLANSKEIEGTGLFLIEMGQGYTDADLEPYLSTATSYRMKVFGGMKLDIPYISAAGLGLDLTYSAYKLKNGYSGRYNKLSWDWFHLPLRWGFFTFTPGINWNVIDIKIEQIDVAQISIRPGLMLDAGLSFAVAQRFAINANIRYESLWFDNEKMVTGESIDITGNHILALFGLSTYF
jgi:hypothetical protein